MENKIISFGKFETASILINALIVKLLLGLPQLLCRRAGSAAWLVTLASGALFLLLVWLILKLYDRFENRNILQIAEYLCGKPGKWCCAVLLLLPLLFKGAITLRLAADTINLITPYRIPSLLTAVLVGIVMIVAAYRGVEGIARMHALLVPVVLSALVLVTLTSISSFHISNLFPFWGLGQKTVWRESFSSLSTYTDVIYLFLLYPYVKSRRIFRRACFLGTAAATLVQTGILLSYTLATPYPESAELFMPVYQISRIIRFNHNSQSIEAIFYPVWIMSSLLYLSLSANFVVEILGQTSRTKYEKLFIIPSAALMFLIGYLPASVMNAVRLSSYLSPALAVLSAALPFFILCAARIKAGRRRPHEA